jgi:hypothetical protein
MEMILSALLGEGITRSLNFFISKSSKLQPQDLEDRLRRVLLRAQVIIDEGMGRHITNHPMLQQLDMLRDAMHQGHYTLDTFRYQSHKEEDTKDQVVSHCLSLSTLNFLKGFYSSSNRNSQILEELQVAFHRLSFMILDAEKLAVFLTSYPRMYRQPYSMHLLLGSCMFGRQMEAELVLSFLLHTHPNAAEQLEVLPIVGPRKVGKSTLVAHVFYDKRVRDHFSEIVFLSDNHFKSDKLTYLGEGCLKKYQNSTLNKDGRMLVVIEATGDFNEQEWKRMYATCKRYMKIGSKIIIRSRYDKITKLGTTRAVILKHLSDEAFWYFFKTLTFGSTDPVMHPRLAYLAMEIARIMK